MPLAPCETTLFPERLLDDPPRDSSARWWVLHTKPRMEKSLARRLLGREAAFYLPTYEHRLTSGGKVRSSFPVLFPGYLFFHGGDEDRRLALETNLIVRTLDVPDQSGLLADLQRLRQLLATRQNLTPEERLAPGTPVRITAGAMAGLAGVVIRRGRQLRFVVSVRFLGAGASVDVEEWMIEPMTEPTGTTVLPIRP